MKRKILIYTDSRGQHTPRNQPVHDVFALRLAQMPDLDVDVVLCPMKWTTTLDFLDYLKDHPPETYDHIILYTGIVDWSPRHQVSAINDLYNNRALANLANGTLNTREYAKKVINNKKQSFDAVFGEKAMEDYLRRDFGLEYEGQPTVNMYGLEMARQHLLPQLKAIKNLIFINSNRFVPGWEGDFTRGRPANIALTEKYSELFRDELGPERVIDLLQWKQDDIKRLTCDNLHLKKEGSDWIYDRICERMEKTAKSALQDQTLHNKIGPGSAAPIAPYGRAIEPPDVMTQKSRLDALQTAGLDLDGKLATLIIGLRIQKTDDQRTKNLLFLLDWIDRFYADLFDVLIVEQDDSSKIHCISEKFKPYVRHEFIYNPKAYNRGWGYNVAVRHFTKAGVVALMDTDVLTGSNFVNEILDCHCGKYKVISPYTNVYFSDAAEASSISRTYGFGKLTDPKKVGKPTTLTGGVLIVDRKLYEDVCGFEQYTSYGCEDRALDVTLLNHCSPETIRMAPYTYVHMHHPSDKVDRNQLDLLLSHLKMHYGCEVDRTLSADDYIHKNCNHASTQKTVEYQAKRRASYGHLELYASDRPITINGCYMDNDVNCPPEVMFPPEFAGLDKYETKELYKAPDPDSARIGLLYNSFKGKRCFIIGNGPSLNKHDLALLDNECVFGVNSFFYKTEETGFRPTFYVVEDNAVMKENAERIREFEAPYKFFPTIYKNLHPERDNVFFFKMNRGFYEKSSPNYCVPRFSTDASKVLYCGQSVTYINLQIAYFLGFSEVYLIGMDFDYVIPQEHERRGDLIVSTTDDPNHFHKDYFGVGKTWKDPKLDRVAMNYRQAKLSYEAVGRRIYNATIGGKLEIFPRVDYEALLRDPATSRKRSKQIAPALLTLGEDDGRAPPPEGSSASTATTQVIASTPPAPAVKKAVALVPDSPERTPAQIRAARFAKLKRDPHAFFQDSHSALLRPLQYVFKPAGISKGQAEIKAQTRREAGGLFSFLPASRKALGGNRAALRGERHRSEATLRAELARLQRDSQTREASLRDELAKLRAQAEALETQKHADRRALRDEFGEQFAARDQRLTVLQGEVEAKIAAGAEEMKAAMREELAALHQRLVTGAEQSAAIKAALQTEIAGRAEEMKAVWREELAALDERLANAADRSAAIKAALQTEIAGRAEEMKAVWREELAALDERLIADAEKSAESEIALRAEIAAQSAAAAADKAALGEGMEKRLQAELLALRQGIDQRLHAEVDERSQRHLGELRQELADLAAELDARSAAAASANAELASDLISAKNENETRLSGVLENLKAGDEILRSELEQIRDAHQNSRKVVHDSIETLKASDARHAKVTDFLRQRVMTSEQQIGALRYPNAPQTLVFFGHHKCASRLFRSEVFRVVAEATGAQIHQYKIKSPPFHYSRGDELDLCNIDFDMIGKNGRDVVLFSNASERTFDRLNRTTGDWKGIRIIRDPRQVVVSNYFHHKGDHHYELNGWIYDQLKHDQPILRELPEEEGLLHELDHISKDVIETQILAPFQDERVLTIKLEDFTKNEEIWLKRISEFLGIADIAGVDLSRTFANPDSRPWQQHFTSRLRMVFKKRYGQALIDLGYAEDLNW